MLFIAFFHFVDFLRKLINKRIAKTTNNKTEIGTGGGCYQGIVKDTISEHSGTLQKIFYQLGDSDNLIGLSSINNRKTKLVETIIDLEALGNWSDALTRYNSAIDENPKDFELKLMYLNCLKNLGQFETMFLSIDGMEKDFQLNSLSLSSKSSSEDEISQLVNQPYYNNMIQKLKSISIQAGKTYFIFVLFYILFIHILY